ncbi:hypothetical protein HL653_08550 [Sphingomonas sp. AP4-R1]|nr:hypothetical protein HL653_08550 [Sphingomonas sp. AP4-R1]
MKSIIALQEQALEVQRLQIQMATKAMEAGRDAVTAQKQGLSAMEAGAKAWRNWFELWSIKP